MNGSIVTVVSMILGLTVCVGAEEAAPLGALARMPVKEVTVFKDGHAFLLHQGRMPTDPAGNVLLDYLPAPVLGTFWPYSSEKGVVLSAVVAGQRRVLVQRTALTIQELIEGNAGATVMVTESPAGRETDSLRYQATILGVTTRSSEEREATAPPPAPNLLPEKGNVVMLKTADGTKAVNMGRILDVTFTKEPPKSLATSEEFRNLLTMKLDWNGAKPKKDADIGLMYVQRGIRWIPHYKVTIDGAGKAVVKLQATLLNELTDLNDVTCHLVIGVPTFKFKDMVDPISLQQALAQLSQYFRESDPSAGQYQMLSNAMMTQSARMGEYRQSSAQPPSADLGPDVGGADQSEDLFLFTVKHVSLRKGQRMVLPVAEFTVPYTDVYTLDLPVAPPTEAWRNFNSQQQSELARLLNAPKVMHKLRIENKSKYPLTTAPAMIVRDDRVLAQGMTTYTAVGGNLDLPLTAAVDIQVKKSERETKRTPNAMTWNGDRFARADLAGTIALTNYRKEPVTLEVVRHVLGEADAASSDGKVESINAYEDDSFMPSGDGRSSWWNWHSWPYWWHRVNSVGRITWKLTLDPGKKTELTYDWHYFWQ
jgi:hypothetical protein